MLVITHVGAVDLGEKGHWEWLTAVKKLAHNALCRQACVLVRFHFDSKFFYIRGPKDSETLSDSVGFTIHKLGLAVSEEYAQTTISNQLLIS